MRVNGDASSDRASVGARDGNVRTDAPRRRQGWGRIEPAAIGPHERQHARRAAHDSESAFVNSAMVASAQLDEVGQPRRSPRRPVRQVMGVAPP